MEPFVAKKLPHDYTLSKDILKLLCEAEENYGEYKGYLKTLEFDYKYFLECMLINDIYYSFKIDNNRINKEDMFLMPYKVKNNDVIQYNNIKKSMLYGVSNICQNGLNVDYLHKIHKSLFKDCKKDANIKGSGHFRKKQTYILKPGIAG